MAMVSGTTPVVFWAAMDLGMDTDVDEVIGITPAISVAVTVLGTDMVAVTGTILETSLMEMRLNFSTAEAMVIVAMVIGRIVTATLVGSLRRLMVTATEWAMVPRFKNPVAPVPKAAHEDTDEAAGMGTKAMRMAKSP